MYDAYGHCPADINTMIWKFDRNETEEDWRRFAI